MAIRFLNNLDLGTNEIQNVKAQNLASDPSGYAGQFIFNTTSNTFKYYNGTGWISLDGTGDISGVTAGTGLSGGGTSGNVTLAVDYAGANNIILSADDGTALTLATSDKVMISDATDTDVKFVNLSQLSAAIGGGTVTSVAQTHAGDAFSVGGSPITSSGTLAITMNGASTDYIDGEGNLVVFPTLTSGTVTSVAVTGGTGIGVTGSPITSSGTISLSNTGVTSIVAGTNVTISGGTGAVTINASTQGDITGVTAGTGLSGGGTSGTVTLDVDYIGNDNIILAAADKTAITVASTDLIMLSDVTDSNVGRITVSQLQSAIGGGTVTSVAATGANGLTVSGSPITSSGTLAFGISAGGIANDRLANSTISGIALGGVLKTLTASTGLTMSSYNGSVAINDLQIDYSGTDNAILAATAATPIGADTIWFSDATDNNIKKGLVSDLPFDASGGTVTSIATPATGGLTGGTITTSGSLSLKNFASLSANKIMKWDDTSNQLTNSLMTDDGSTVTISGNLTVNGTTTTIDSTTVSIKDNMMEYANGNDVAGGGANSVDIGWFGNYVISSVDYYPAMFYDASASTSASAPKFRLGNATTKPGSTATIANKGILIADVEGTITGNADTATKLANSRSISLTGDGSWSVNFDGSASVSSGLTLATVNGNVGSFGSASNTLSATVNAKGLVTAMSATAISITASQVSDFCTAVESCIASSHQYAQNIGNGSATTYTVSHNFGTRDVIVQVYDTASPYDTLYLEVQRTSTNALTLLSTSAISSNGARCLVTKVA